MKSCLVQREKGILVILRNTVQLFFTKANEMLCSYNIQIERVTYTTLLMLWYFTSFKLAVHL